MKLKRLRRLPAKASPGDWEVGEFPGLGAGLFLLSVRSPGTARRVAPLASAPSSLAPSPSLSGPVRGGERGADSECRGTRLEVDRDGRGSCSL